MTTIELRTVIHAPRERVFDLARSIDAHVASADGTGERAIAGVTTGLIGLGERVTWEARHLGIRHRMTVEITQLDRPRSFHDAMVEGPFAAMTHEHSFEEDGATTVMLDRFHFRAPLGLLGRVAAALVLKQHLTRFLRARRCVESHG